MDYQHTEEQEVTDLKRLKKERDCFAMLSMMKIYTLYKRRDNLTYLIAKFEFYSNHMKKLRSFNHSNPLFLKL